MGRSFILFFTLAYSSLLAAQDQPLVYCSVSGYFEGEGSYFYKDLVTGLVARNNLSSNSLCITGEKRGKEAALYYKEHGKHKNEEAKYIAQQAAIYKAKVRVFINKGIGL